MIEINNGQKLKIEVIDDYLKITTLNSNNEIEKQRIITGEDFVLLYDYFIMKKEHNEPIL